MKYWIFMSIPPTCFDAFVRRYKFLAIEKMGVSEGELPFRSWKNAIFKLNLQNLVHIFCQHFTENPLFFSNEILAIFMSIPLTFPVLMPLPNYNKRFLIEGKTDLSERRVPLQKLIEIMQFSNSICTGTRRYSDMPLVRQVFSPTRR